MYRAQTNLKSVGSAASLKSAGSNKGIFSSLQRKPDLVENNMKIHDRKYLKQLWITGPIIQISNDTKPLLSQAEKRDESVGDERSTKHSLAVPTGAKSVTHKEALKNMDIENSIYQALEDVQMEEKSCATKNMYKLTSVIRSNVERPHVELSQNEREFLGINKSLKGIGVSSRFHKQVTKTSQ